MCRSKFAASSVSGWPVNLLIGGGLALLSLLGWIASRRPAVAALREARHARKA